MNGRSLVVCTLVGTIVLFAWQTLSNAALPWHQATMRPFTDTTAASVRALRPQAPANGVYWNAHGVLAIVSATPDYADQTTLLGKMLTRQAAIDLFGAVMICILAARIRDQRPSAVAAATGFAALAAMGVQELSLWNWYGFGVAWALVNVIDTAIAFYLAGWAIAWVARRMRGVELPVGAGYATSEAGVPVA